MLIILYFVIIIEVGSGSGAEEVSKQLCKHRSCALGSVSRDDIDSGREVFRVGVRHDGCGCRDVG